MMKSNKALLVAVLVAVAAPAMAATEKPAAKPAAAVEVPAVSYVATAKAKASEFGSAVKDFYSANSRFQNFFNGAATALAAYEVISRATASNDNDNA